MTRKKLLAVAVISAALNIGTYGNAHAAEDLKVMPANRAETLHSLYRVFPVNEIGDTAATEGTQYFDLQVSAANLAGECTYDNFDPVCRATTLYVTVTTDELGGKFFGVELGPAFAWELNKVVYRTVGTPCVELRLTKRELMVTNNRKNWVMTPYSLCLAPAGIVEGLKPRSSK